MQDFTEVFKDIKPLGNAGYSGDEINTMLNEFTRTYKKETNRDLAYDLIRYIKSLKRTSNIKSNGRELS